MDENGNLKKILCVGNDITRRKKAEEALQFERSQLLSVFDSIDEAIYVSDTGTNEILYANKAMKEMFQKELIGGICYKEIQNRDSKCDFCTNVILLNEKGVPYRWEFHNPTVDKDFLIVDRIIKWPDGRDVRFELAIDITQRKRAENSLSEAKTRAELYLDLMSHDINNINHAMLGYLEIAQDFKSLKDEEREFSAERSRRA
jgi:PAS domain-containing protein